ncbi:hypothetical protein MLD38_006797 [Melastoma candidum]|uniref:Uncharacterized protein n=1 Tax=Melastoma candidum TaxID=119954 RepID=A0ACB9RT83_9MYRT|nr:hypothetical protein MLD38_006797 [Melastoma candidum]
MGKRKKLGDRVGTPPPPPPPPLPPHDMMACTSGVESSSRKKFSSSSDFVGYKPFSPNANIRDSSWDRIIARSSPTHCRHNLRRSMLLKHSRNRHGHHYWRNSGVHLNPSTSYGKVTPPWDKKLSFKLDKRHNLEHPHFTVVDSDRSFARPERIRSSSFQIDGDSLDTGLLQCPICIKLLRKKPYLLGSSHFSGEHNVVAVLVCGHTYHANCLEKETPTENKSDPPCPVCLGSLDAAVEV